MLLLQAMKDTLLSFKAFILDDFDFRSYALVIGLLALLTYFNYKLDFEDSILDRHHNTLLGFVYYICFYVVVYFGGILCMIRNKKVLGALRKPRFYLITLSGLFMICVNKNFEFFTVNRAVEFSAYTWYFIQKISSQGNTLIAFVLSFIVLGWIIGKLDFEGFGLWKFKSDFRIYFILLGVMLPFLFYASTFDDFLRSYPRLNARPFPPGEYLSYLLQYEPVYLLNFIGVEWLFRGFMVLAVIKYCDKRAVILIATIYCIFHFGKPMAECISSFFGGYILGMITYRTHTIWGGVIIHMGVALFMDLFALMTYLQSVIPV